MIAARTTASAPRRAFATIMAIILVALVGATLLSLAVLLNTEYRRTTDASTQAQLRQFLTAGAQVIPVQLASRQPTPAKQSLALPSALATEGATLTFSIATERELRGVDVTIDAELNGQTAEQILHYADSATGWHCTSAKLR